MNAVNRRSGRRIGIGVAVACGAFVLACLAGEWGLEKLYPLTSIPMDAPAAEYFRMLGGALPDTDAGLTLPFRGTESPSPKEPGVFRVVVIGESSSLGVPYSKDLAFGTFFVEGMRAVNPTKKIERVHMGENGRSSAGVLHFLDAALAASADVIVVYSGHNEFTHRLTVASPFGKRRSFPWNWIPRIDDGILQLTDASAVRRTSDANAKIPENLRKEVSGPLDIWGRGDREQNPWSNFPILPRERELHRERFRSDLESMIAKARQRQTPIVFVRPTSHMQCPPLASGLRFDRAASEKIREAGEMLTRDPAAAKELYVAARDLDPAPVRMPTVHREVFDSVMSEHGVPWVDGDACAREATGSEILGDSGFVDFMHPRENVHASIAHALAIEFHKLGLTGISAGDPVASARFRDACTSWRGSHLTEVAMGSEEGLRWFVMLYLIFGNRAAAEERARSCPQEMRPLSISLMLDLATRWGGDSARANRELDAAESKHPEWKPAIDVWRRTLGVQ